MNILNSSDSKHFRKIVGAEVINTGSTNVKIGTDHHNRHLNGIIDEVRIWSTARSQTEIQDNMYSTVLDSQSYLEAYYRFDQSDGTEVIDLTDFDNDGTINGNPTWTTSGADIE